MGLEYEKVFRQMRETLAAYRSVTSKTIPEIVNHKMRDVIAKTISNTPAVTRNQISDQLRAAYVNRAEAYVLTGKRKGQLRKNIKVRYNPYPLARAIIASRMWRKGINPRTLSGQAFADKIDAMIQSRLSSGSYAKSGWIPAAKLFGVSSVRLEQVPTFKPAGSGLLATVDKAVAEIRNDVFEKWDSGSRGYREVAQALIDAVEDVAEETLAYTDEQLRKAWVETTRKTIR